MLRIKRKKRKRHGCGQRPPQSKSRCINRTAIANEKRLELVNNLPTDMQQTSSGNGKRALPQVTSKE